MRRSTTRPGRRWFERALEAGLDFIFPPRCAGCGRHGQFWCVECDRRLKLVSRSGCPSCGFPRIHRGACLACEIGDLTVQSYASYRPPLKQAILQLKYSPDRRLADLMARWLVELYEESRLEMQLIIPVPLADARKRERGYNQVELIASAMAGYLNIPVQAQSLQRVQETGSQVGLTPGERFENVQDAFSAESRFILNQRILLLDDLLTSGATLIGCAHALFQAGAAQVACLTVGRTIV